MARNTYASGGLFNQVSKGSYVDPNTKEGPSFGAIATVVVILGAALAAAYFFLG